MFCRVQRNCQKIVFPYLMVLEYQNITHTSMIIVKFEKPSQVLKHLPVQSYP